MRKPVSAVTRRKFVARSTAVVATGAVAGKLAGHSARAAEVAVEFRSNWHQSPDRVWLGADVWANPLQDWRVANGRAECVNAAADRNIHALTRQLAARSGEVRMSV
ncbi:MAG: twin-arginine translocation pathway signal, partial [Limisphaerales bacterium]